MMISTDFLATRGYRRVTVERTSKAPTDLVLHHNAKPVERIPERNIVPIARRAGGVR